MGASLFSFRRAPVGQSPVAAQKPNQVLLQHVFHSWRRSRAVQWRFLAAIPRCGSEPNLTCLSLSVAPSPSLVHFLSLDLSRSFSLSVCLSLFLSLPVSPSLPPCPALSFSLSLSLLLCLPAPSHRAVKHATPPNQPSTRSVRSKMDALWARVGYRGKEDGWVLTANKRGPMLTAADDQAAAEALWADQVSGER